MGDAGPVAAEHEGVTAFPAGFLWGAATSAHQIEGNNTSSDWWDFEHSGHPHVLEPSGDACDSYHRWEQDLDLLAADTIPQ